MNSSLFRVSAQDVKVSYFQASSDNPEFASIEATDEQGNSVTLFFSDLHKIQTFLSLASVQADKLMGESAKRNLKALKARTEKVAL